MASNDDDVPLAALAAKAPAKTLKLDDDTPLSSLASRAAGPPSKKSVGGTAAKKPPAAGGAGAAKARPKPGQKRRRDSSSSSSSSDSSSSTEAVKKRKAKAVARKNAPVKKGPLKKRQTEENMDGEEDPADNKIKKKKRNLKEDLVAKLLARWWFATPYQKEDWPPQEESFYVNELTTRKYRKVSIQEWEWVPEEDDQGRRKVYELSQFRGVFRTSEGALVDCRPQETCPCYMNFINKDTGVLIDMLISAYQNQLKELQEKSKYAVKETTSYINLEMVKLREFQSKNSYNMNKELK